MTPHIESKKDQIADTVIMPGDPRRAKYIAETFLDNAELVNDVRGCLGYTGYYKGKRITVMASGMGIPSMGIYSYELFKFYDVKNIIRVGSFGAYTDEINLYDIVVVQDSCSESGFAREQNDEYEHRLIGSDELNSKIVETALETNTRIQFSTIHCTEAFYKENNRFVEVYEKYGCVGCEMESFALFHNARILNKHAACILTCSDNLVTKKETTSEEREKSFTKMIDLALNTVLKL